MILAGPSVEADELAVRTGWSLKPEGLCKGDVCVPLPAASGETSAIDAHVLAERLGMPLLHDEELDVWALGPESISGRVLTGAEAPELVLPDFEGTEFRLSSLRGRKVALATWATW